MIINITEIYHAMYNAVQLWSSWTVWPNLEAGINWKNYHCEMPKLKKTHPSWPGPARKWHWKGYRTSEVPSWKEVPSMDHPTRMMCGSVSWWSSPKSTSRCSEMRTSKQTCTESQCISTDIHSIQCISTHTSIPLAQHHNSRETVNRNRYSKQMNKNSNNNSSCNEQNQTRRQSEERKGVTHRQRSIKLIILFCFYHESSIDRWWN